MKLVITDKRIEEVDGKIYSGASYNLGEDYTVEYYTTLFSDGSKLERIYIKPMRDRIPMIYYSDNYFGEHRPTFSIQTTSYGALTPDEITEVIRGYEIAIEAVDVLTKHFCK